MNELKQIVFTIFDTQVEGADVYNNNGSTWLIFTDKKEWVFELTKEGTLWYNYYFFRNFFELLSLEVIENQNYITEWVESIIQNGVKNTITRTAGRPRSVEDTIQNGVKNTKRRRPNERARIEDTIQNGVKETTPGGYLGSASMNGKKVHQFESAKQNNEVEEVIENGVKDTKPNYSWLQWNDATVEDTIQNGVKVTNKSLRIDGSCAIEDVIQNRVKHTHLGGKDRKIGEIKDIIENGVKETNPHFLEILNTINFEPVIKEMKRMNEVNIVLEKAIKETKTPNEHNAVAAFDFLKYNGTDSVPDLIDRVIQNGIKEVKELPDKSGELRGYGDYYIRQEDRTKPHTQYVDDVLLNGIKATKYCQLHSAMSAAHIIRDGIKETNWRRVDNHPTYLDGIIKTNK